MVSIPGYNILEEIHEGINTSVFRARKEGEEKTVIIKLLKIEYPTPADLAKFRHQYEITQVLNIAGVVKSLQLEKWNQGLFLVFEDGGYQSLKQFSESSNHNLIDTLKIAIKIVNILGEIHKNSIIHLDIKPQNILINPESLEVKITDFSIATRLEFSHQSFSNPDLLEGTLAYLSPEQTGRMNRSIDYRTDFYSLGVTLYEILTGKLPFIAKDSLELVHCHIAKKPIPPREINLEIPQAVSDIIMKLLSKTAEERYQTAYGLKLDLEKCLNQQQSTGKIESFILGKQDISNKFKISQKLYGREQEIATLMAAFERVSNPYETPISQGETTPVESGGSELILLSGFSGIGKSAIVNEIHKPIVEQRGYFISGKFDQFNWNIPYQSLIQAFQGLIRQLLTESQNEITTWKQKLLNALGENGQVIIDVIPELELIIGCQPAVPYLAPTETKNRFNLLFQKFIGVFTQREHPLVLFLDDLQWVDLASLSLINLLIANPENQYLLIIGAYRDNEVNPAHPLMLTIDEIKKNGTIVTHITLKPLTLTHVNQLIADTLHSPESKTLPLAQLVLEKTNGNPFFINQLLKSLSEAKLLNFQFPNEEGQGGWDWNLKKIQEVGITENVVELMAKKIKKLPVETQEVLKIAAFIGHVFDLKTLAIASNKSQVATATELWPSVVEGLIIPINNTYQILLYSSEEIADGLIDSDLNIEYRFLHDRVQQASYSLIPESEKKSVHLKVGRLLLNHTSPEELELKIFDIINHLNLGRELIKEPEFKAQLAQLNLIAGRKAKASTAYEAAVNHLEIGRSILPGNIWEDRYDLAFKLHRELLECQYLTGNFLLAKALFNITLGNAKSKFEQADMYYLLILLTMTQGEFEEGMQAGLAGLKLMGIEVPETEEQLQVAIATELQQVKLDLAQIKVPDLLNSPEMVDPEKLVSMNLLVNLWGASFGGTNLNLNLWSVLKMTHLSLTYGNANTSAFGYSVYGLLLSVQEDYQMAYEFGDLSLKLLEKYHNISLTGKVINLFCHTMNPYKNHLRTNLALYRTSYTASKCGGDLIYGVWALFFIIWTRFESGDNLKEIDEEAEKYLIPIAQTNYLSMLYALKNLHHGIKKLQGIEEEFDEMQGLRQWREGNLLSGVNWYYYLKAQVLYTFEDYKEALEICRISEPLLPANFSFFPLTKHYFNYSLVLAAVYPQASDVEKQEYWELLERNQNKMKKWADRCPENYLHKYLLVAAEMAKISGKELEAMDLYRQAIASAREHEFTQNEALANELAAKFYLAKGWDEIARMYMKESHYRYSKWGASAKIKQLEKKYPILLQWSPKSRNKLGFSQIISSTSSNSSNSIDLLTVIKASETFSREIIMSNLLVNLIKIIIENAGASQGFLILKRSGKLTVEAVASVDSEEVEVLRSIPLETCSLLPPSIVNYVAKTKSNLVLNDATKEGLFSQDSYIIKNQPKSVLCTSILHQGKLKGVLYLENNLTTGAFTAERLEVLKVLSSQAAISLENAMLYNNLESQVEARTVELQEKNNELIRAFQKLEQAQSQLIQSEKMSSLGQLVAGVAHEINNPINFIYGNIIFAKQHIQDLLDFLHLYQERYPQVTAEIEAEATEVDLEYVAEDLPKIISSMEVGADRIRQIVLSLKNFSRLGQSELKLVDIHEGIENTLLILRHRLQQKINGKEIQVIKEYGQLPVVQCYAGELNQVFMNILSNAIDAIADRFINHLVPPGNTTKDLAESPNPTISIRTEVMGATGELNSDRVAIHIADNGCGMTEEVRRKLFDPFFTTKPVGKGTGLGLSISYQIVTEKHGGRLQCISSPGQGAEFIVEIPICGPSKK